MGVWSLSLQEPVTGGVALPYLMAGPGRRAVGYIFDMPGATFVAAVVGLVVGLIVASLVSIPFYSLGHPAGWAAPVAISLALGCGGMLLGVKREGDIRAILPGWTPPPAPERSRSMGRAFPALNPCSTWLLHRVLHYRERPAALF